MEELEYDTIESFSYIVRNRQNCANKTRPYDGIPEVLSALRNRGIRTAVVSNKVDFAVQQLCVQYFDGIFDLAVGEREGVRKKPAPDAIYTLSLNVLCVGLIVLNVILQDYTLDLLDSVQLGLLFC